MNKTKTEWNPREATVGQTLINWDGDEAKVAELLPSDPEYFAFLEDAEGTRWAALAENPAQWKPKN